MELAKYQKLLDYLLFLQPQISHLITLGDIEDHQEDICKLKRLAEIGKATKSAYSKGAFLIYDIVENSDNAIVQYNCDETIDELLLWLESAESEDY